jgi:signal transduction histidine kinase
MRSTVPATAAAVGTDATPAPRIRGGRRSRAFDRSLVAVAVPLVIVEQVARWRIDGPAPDPHTGLYLVISALAVASAVALLVRRTSPEPALVLGVVVSVVMPFWGLGSAGTFFVCAIALYSGAAYVGRRRALSMAGLLLVVTAVSSIPNDFGVWERVVNILVPVLFLAALWLWGDNVAIRRAYVEALRARVGTLESEREARSRAAVAEERARIARDMHDIVAHHVGAIVVQAQGARYALAGDPAAAQAALDTISDSARSALSELRSTIAVLTDIGGTAEHTPQPEASGIHTLIEPMRAAGLPVSMTTSGDLADLPRAVSLAVYRVAQESLTNALKHGAPGGHTSLRIERSRVRVTVLVVNDVSESHGTPEGSGHGLLGMGARVSAVGGRLSAGPEGGRWRVEAVLPAETLT